MTKSRECPSGKVPYRTRHLAALGARRLARMLNREGRIAEPMFCYTCGCGALHLTRARAWAGKPNHEVFHPVSEKLQVELMTPEARERYWEAEEQRRAAAAEREFARLPHPLPTAAKAYANRPRGLRRGAH